MTVRCFNCGERYHGDKPEEWAKVHIHPNFAPNIKRDDS